MDNYFIENTSFKKQNLSREKSLLKIYLSTVSITDAYIHFKIIVDDHLFDNNYTVNKIILLMQYVTQYRSINETLQ